MIDVLIVDDSTFIRRALTRVLSMTQEVRVIAEASSGPEALEKLRGISPAVVILDVDMPGMDGLSTLRELMVRRPGLPVIMLSALTRQGGQVTMEALAAGAVDFLDKTTLNFMDFENLSRELLGKLRPWATRAQRPEATGARTPTPTPLPLRTPGPSHASPPASIQKLDWERFDVCVIGASTGGPPALQSILEPLPASFPVPILIVQHMAVGFTRPFAERLDRICAMHVTEAQDGDRAVPGTALVACAGQHLVVGPERVVMLQDEPRSSQHRPSVDVTMTSAAHAFPGRVLGILLTGMGDDGAEGMRAIHDGGGLTIAESEASCVVYGMPRAAHLRGGVMHMLPLQQICQLMTGPRRR